MENGVTIELPSYYKDKIVKKVSVGINPDTGKRNYTFTNRKPVILFPDNKLRRKYFQLRDRHNKKDKVNSVITYDNFLLIIKSNCVYCGSSNNITVDRIDSTKGYINENVQSLCKICNVMKWNHTEINFLSHVTKICSYKQLI